MNTNTITAQSAATDNSAATSHTDYSDYSAVKAPAAGQTPQVNLCRGFWLIVIGLLLLSPVLNLAAAVAPLLLVAPFVYFTAKAVLQYRSTGSVCHGLLWAMFGTAFVAAAGIESVTGGEVLSSLIVPLALIAFGAYRLSGSKITR